MQINRPFLLFYLEGEGTDEVAVAEEVDVIEPVRHFFHGPVAGAVKGFSAILYLLFQGIGDLSALEGEEVLRRLAEEVTDGVDDTHVEVL